jgi:hypothetical protein
VILEVEASCLVFVWWWSLHALLLMAAWLLGVAILLKLLAAAAIVGHAALRRPSAPPRLVIVSADGCCVVPEWGDTQWALGARTVVCPFWIRLDVRLGPTRRDILLFADQVPPDAWRRVRALLMRIRCD